MKKPMKEEKHEPVAWKMSYTTEENLEPIERLILELRGANRCLDGHRVVLFWLFVVSMVAHVLR